MKDILKSGLILFIITAVAGMLLGLVFEITKEPIAIQEQKMQDEAMKIVLPDCTGSEVIYTAESKKETISKVQKGTANGEDVGYVFNVTTSGFGGKINMMVGLDISGVVTGVTILKHSESPGYGSKAEEPSFLDQYIGKDKFPLTVVKQTDGGSSDEIQAISGATRTSKAITNAVNMARTWLSENSAGGN